MSWLAGLLCVGWAWAQEPAPEPATAVEEPPSTALPAAEQAPAPPEPEVVRPASSTLDRIAAVVNDEVVTLTEVYELGGPFIQQSCPTDDPVCAEPVEAEVLDALIRRVLIRQELTELDLQVTAADVDAAIDRTVREFQLADRAELRAEVERSGKRWDQYREELFEFLRNQNFQGRVLAPRVSVSDDEVRDLYQRSARREQKQEVLLSALGIIIPEGVSAAEEAEMVQQTQALVDALNAGTLAWHDAVRDYDGAALADALGGQAYKQGTLVEPVDAAVFAPSVVPGRVLAPVRLGQVMAVLRVDERRVADGSLVALEDIMEELRNQIFQEKLAEAEEQWYQRARRESAIDVKIGAAPSKPSASKVP
jgi:peptidyl-prolyl cis-trans isomerase SurA